MADRGRAAHRRHSRSTSSPPAPPGFEALVDDDRWRSTVDVRLRVRGPGVRPRRRAGRQPDGRARRPSGFASTRDLPGDDFGRMANQQHLLEAILAKLRAARGRRGVHRERRPRGAAAPGHRPVTHASSTASRRRSPRSSPQQTTTCVLTGPTTSSRATCSVVYLDAGVRRSGWPPTPPTTPPRRRLPLSPSAQPGVAGQHDRLRAVGDLQLHEDVARVVAHRLGRERRAPWRSRRSPGRPR